MQSTTKSFNMRKQRNIVKSSFQDRYEPNNLTKVLMATGMFLSLGIALESL